MTEIARDEDHSGGAPTIGDTGIRVINVACAYEHDGYSSDEIAEFYPALTLEDIHGRDGRGNAGDADADQLDYAASNGWPLLTLTTTSSRWSNPTGSRGSSSSHSMGGTSGNWSGVSTPHSSAAPTVT